MHILAEQIRSLDDAVQAVDLGQSPADVVFLSFSDSDLSLMAAVHAGLGAAAPTLRLANLAALRHPYSVDLYLENTARHARFVLVRLLGGADYWRYGVDELAMAARRHGCELAIIAGDDRPDPRLAAASTLPAADLDRLVAWFAAGGPDNVRSAIAFIANRLGGALALAPPRPQPAAGRYAPAVHADGDRRALVVFYRAHLNAGDVAPIAALADALAAAGFAVLPLYVTSLKDGEALPLIAAEIDVFRPDIIINTTAFSAQLPDGGSVLDRAGVPVIQAALATTSRQVWQAGTRGLAAADLAMNVVLPEVDGRLIGPVLSFKAVGARQAATEFTSILHAPDADGIARLVRLAAGWCALAARPRGERTLALVLSNYQGRGGRTAFAVGLDGPASLVAIADDLRAAGFSVGELPDAAALIRALETGAAYVDVPLADYGVWFATLPAEFRRAVRDRWGEPEEDVAAVGAALRLRVLVAGRLIVAVQPDRGLAEARATDHHDPALPPPHAYVAFYLWLRRRAGIDAMIHLGTHGTLEWLPGKAVALSPACPPAVLTDGLPVVYPFIVNNPGEAAQARRRIGALTLGHLTPPLIAAGSDGDVAELEMLVDEFAAAQALDPRRARHLADAILVRAEQAGVAEAAGLTADLDAADKLARLDAWICDVKDMRIADGLHVFGRAPAPDRLAAHAAATLGGPDLVDRLAACGAAERAGLLAALDGRFVPAGPAGAPGRGRLDCLPTGRNLYAIDPRSVPTRTAWEIGRRTAEEVVARYVEDHGDWPRAVVLDVWASASMRTGGDDLAQALALLGVRPTWDGATGRVSGFEILAPARLGRSRVDVTLRVSGLFRDVFGGLIELYDAAVRAVAALDEPADVNPLAGQSAASLSRVFGAAPGAFGAGVSARLDSGDWQRRSELADDFLAASGHAYDRDGARPARHLFEAQVRQADAFVHVQDLEGQDVLSNDAFAAHEGGFAAAVEALGGKAALYHVDTTGGGPRVRTLAEEVGRVVHGRAANRRWIAGQMRHGHRGAGEIAEAIANLCALAALADVVSDSAFDRLFDATFGDDAVRDFLVAANPLAAADSLARLRQALARGHWTCRRNFVAARLDDTEALL